MLQLLQLLLRCVVLLRIASCLAVRVVRVVRVVRGVRQQHLHSIHLLIASLLPQHAAPERVEYAEAGERCCRALRQLRQAGRVRLRGGRRLCATTCLLLRQGLQLLRRLLPSGVLQQLLRGVLQAVHNPPGIHQQQRRDGAGAHADPATAAVAAAAAAIPGAATAMAPCSSACRCRQGQRLLLLLLLGSLPCCRAEGCGRCQPPPHLPQQLGSSGAQLLSKQTLHHTCSAAAAAAMRCCCQPRGQSPNGPRKRCWRARL